MMHSTGATPRRQKVLAVAALLGGLSTVAHPSPARAQAASPSQTVLAFDPASVGVAAGAAQQLTASFSVTGYTGSFTPTAALRYGLHYSAASVQCTGAGSGETCTVGVDFVPALPGGRRDALLLMNGSTVLATVLLYGVGQGPLALIQPGIVTQPIAAYANYLYQSAVDESGTVYVLGQNSNTVVSLTKSGVVTTLPITATSPESIAVDGAGTLYIAQNTYSHSIVTYGVAAGQGTIPVDPPSPYTPCSNAGTLEYLNSVTVDGIGDLFATEILCQEIFELKATGTYATTAIAPAITQPSTLTVDTAGNVFVGGYTINELTTGGVQTQVNSVGASEGLAVDAAGTLYATRYTGGGVAELAPGSYGTLLASLDTGASPLGASVAPDGTVYVGNYTNLDKVDRSQGVIAFGEQTSGTTTSAEDVSLYNGGNASLTVSGITVTGPGFVVVSAATSGCTVGTVLPPGALCNVAVTWTPPHAGTFSGTLSLASNSLNATTTQTVALSGFVYGVYVTASPDPLDFGFQAAGTMASLPVTLDNGGDLYAAGIGAPSSDNPAFTVSLGTCTSSVAVGSSCALSVTFDPTATQAYSGTVTLSASSAGGGPNQPVAFTVQGTTVEPPEASADAGPDATVTPDASLATLDASVASDASEASAVDAPPVDAVAAVEASAGDDASTATPEEDAAAADAGPYVVTYDAAPQGSGSGGGGWSCGLAGARSGGGSLSAVGLVAVAALARRRRAGQVRPVRRS
jgi:hypothetical protein